MKITKESHPEFYTFLQDCNKKYWDEEHRKGSNFYCNYLIDVDDIPKEYKDDYVLDGIWMSERIIDDYTYGTTDNPAYYEKVEAVEIKTITYKPVQDEL